MHVVALRREVYERDPWIAPALVAAFERAKTVGWQRVDQANTPAVMLPWLSRDLAEIEHVFGADHWPYGVGPNYPTLDATCQFHFEQGLSSRRLQPEELFAPTTLGGAAR
jgi:4,5-dihydroxyphthalate decarboxylase